MTYLANTVRHNTARCSLLNPVISYGSPTFMVSCKNRAARTEACRDFCLLSSYRTKAVTFVPKVDWFNSLTLPITHVVECHFECLFAFLQTSFRCLAVPLPQALWNCLAAVFISSFAGLLSLSYRCLLVASKCACAVLPLYKHTSGVLQPRDEKLSTPVLLEERSSSLSYFTNHHGKVSTAWCRNT